ncbi:MAG TPA: hypothetical protein VKR58_15065, partial [Aquella sp.]|nr:hypothetical protein [Aquella sp.]
MIITRSPQNKTQTHEHPEEPPSVHISRKLFVDSLRKKTVEYLERYKQRPDYLIFIRWICTQKLLDFTNKDPLIPYNKDDNESLYQEISKLRGLQSDYKELLEKLFLLIQGFHIRDIRGELSVNLENDVYTLNYGSIFFNLSVSSYDKLRGLHQKEYPGEPEKMDMRIYNLLCRYEALSAPGYHASIPEQLSKTLRERLGVTHQLFASPFNCDSNLGYTSAYPDTDKYFGSKGNFFEKYPELFAKGGSFEANPPFMEEYLAALSIIILKTMKSENPFSFVVVYPCWTDAIGYTLLKESEFNVLPKIVPEKSLEFLSGKHMYTQSSQYWSKGVDRPSNSNS